jgi:hypothetical protein
VTGLGPDRVTTNVSSGLLAVISAVSTAQAARCLAASSGSGSPALAVREQATFRPPRTPTTTASTSRPVSAAEGTGCRNARLRSAPPTSSTEGKISRSSRAAAIRAARSHSRSTGCQERSAPSRACAVSAPRGVLLGGQPRRLDVRRDQDRVVPGDDGPHQRGLLVADHLVLEPAVSQATAGWLLNSAASWPLSSSQSRTRASFSPTSAARLMGQGRRARPRLARTG